MNGKAENDAERMNDEAKSNFLREAVSHLENRIRLVDDKIGYLMGIQAGFAAVIFWVIKEHLWTGTSSPINFLISFFLVGILSLAAVVIFLLVQTIRPTKRILGMWTDLPRMDVEDYILWPEGRSRFTAEQYKGVIKRLNWPKVRENYEKTHFALFEHTRRKYRLYRLAVFSMKLTILFGFFGVGILALLKWTIR